ncbi:MAG: hypothetical protein AAGA96_01010 [Verrucomicrobiota bacterium]
MTETAPVPRGTLFYDGTCRYCVNRITQVGGMLAQIGVATEPFGDGANEQEMKLRWHDGRLLGGAEVLFFLARRVWWAVPLGWLEWVPGCRAMARWVYGKVAERRHCLRDGSACRI